MGEFILKVKPGEEKRLLNWLVDELDKLPVTDMNGNPTSLNIRKKKSAPAIYTTNQISGLIK